MRTGQPETCWWCGVWAICVWSMGPIARRCMKCVREYDEFMATHA